MINASAIHDLVGLGWRSELAASIHVHLDEIEVLEVIADNYFHASKKNRQSLAWLAKQIPMYLHGVGMGLASSFNVDMERVDAMARLVNEVQPLAWSEHLSFVRANKIEIGHLAAPPRTHAVISNTARNVQIASLTVGSTPHLENIATLVEPLGSEYDEAKWIARSIHACDAPLMLDLHNLYANALNNGRDPLTELSSLPLHRVTVVHLSGGVMIEHSSGQRKLLDDHLHDVPEEVFGLLTALAQRTTNPLHVIIERDGAYPSFDVIREQLHLAREAMKHGRQQPLPQSFVEERALSSVISDDDLRVAQQLEYEMAKLYAGKQLLNDSPASHMISDAAGMELAIRSYAHKRSKFDQKKVAG
ncbi:MAG TPA: DUF692 family protein [Steroidobacteraceae bacterium]|nr:DUF692 family protein [Steroidobacteraceae bacterium]